MEGNMGRVRINEDLIPLQFKFRWKVDKRYGVSLFYRIYDFFRLAIRRYYFLAFRKKYIEKSLKLRKGKCKHCGCCMHTWVICPYQKGKDCLKWKKLPYICKIYPFDEKDKSWFSKRYCGFYWEKM